MKHLPPDPVAHERPNAPRMASLVGRRHVVIGALFAGVSAAGLALAPRDALRPMPRGTLDTMIPDAVGPWRFVRSSGVVLPPPDALSDKLYNNVVTRVYEAPDRAPVMLLVAYSATQDGMLQVHRPQFCYTAGGYRLGPTTDVDVFDARGARYGANSFVATRPEWSETVLYWIRIGKAFPQSWLGQRTAVMDANLAGRIPDGLLARVSSPNPDAPDAIENLRAFVTALDRASSPALHALLFGSRPGARA